MISLEDAVIGTKYKIYGNDCCLTVELEGTFLGFKNFEGEPCSYDDEQRDEAVFDIGTIGYSYADLHLEKING